MKVLFDVDHAFAWAHGGVQVLVEHLLSALPMIEVDVEPMRWWDSAQTGDIIHTFYKARGELAIARQKGYAIVSNVFLDFLSSNGAVELAAKKYLAATVKRFLPNYAMDLGWSYDSVCHASIYASQHEARLGQRLFGADPGKSHVILHGVEEQYFSAPGPGAGESSYLVTVGTIHPRKNCVLLARLAHTLKIPVRFIGKPYSADAYFAEFSALVDQKYVLYQQPVSEEEKIELLRGARGFVTLSRGESGGIAVLEAFATGCPVFFPDLPWARAIYDGYGVFGAVGNYRRLASQLRAFYDSPERRGPRFPVQTWGDVARQYRGVYESVLRSERRCT